MFEQKKGKLCTPFSLKQESVGLNAINRDLGKVFLEKKCVLNNKAVIT